MFVVAVDFEMADRDMAWLSYCFIVSHYPSGNLIDIRSGSCERSPCEYHPVTAEFWREHSGAHAQITKDGRGHTPEKMEQKMMEDFLFIRAKYPNIRILSDNVCLDLFVLSRILLRNGHESVLYGPDGKFQQPVCAWSFRSACNTSGGHYIKYGHRDIDCYFGPKHTPQADCARIISSYFKCLDKQRGGPHV